MSKPNHIGTAANTLAAWLKARLDGVAVHARWPEAGVKLAPKAVTVLLAGPREDELLEPVAVERVDTGRGRAIYTWRVRACKQPMQLDVWTTSHAARDDLVARLERAVNVSEAESIGVRHADPVRSGVLLRLPLGWDGFCDFLFDAASEMDTPDATQRAEYRATARGHAWMDLTVRAESARLARATLRLRLTQDGRTAEDTARLLPPSRE